MDNNGKIKGKIMKGIGGFYYVDTAEGLFECKARGIFRNERQKPLVGDDVELEILDREALLGSIEKILPRRSSLIRPAVANVDQAMVVFAVTSPEPPLNLLDRFLVSMEQAGLETLVVFNKADLGKKGRGEELQKIYSDAGYRSFLVCAEDGTGTEELKALLLGKTTTVAGPSGVGKSSLINRLFGKRMMETGDISEKIARGKHTTRHSEIFPMGEETYLFDTPGFSSLELFDMEKEELWEYFPEFLSEEKSCKFALCSHVTEPVKMCGVKQALEAGRISNSRYENYCLLYEDLKNRRKY